jgi:tetratricopeptide (TPR) repeat protein
VGKVVLFSFPGALLGLLGLWGWNGRDTRAGWGYGLAILAAGGGIALFPNLLSERLFLISNYWTPFQGFWVFLSVMGLWTMGMYLAREKKAWVGLLSVAIAASAVMWWPKLSHIDQPRNLLSRNLGVNLLQGLPKGAVIFPEGDTLTSSVLHACWVERLRPDVYVMPAVFVGERWGFERVGSDLNLPVGHLRMPLTTGERLNWMERSVALEELGLKRPVFTNTREGICEQSIAGSELVLEPAGMAFRLMKNPSKPDEARQIAWDTLRHQNLQGILGVSDGSPTKDFSALYINPFLLSGNAMQAAGRWVEACDDYAEALRLVPNSLEAYSDLSAVVAPLGMPEMAEGFCRKALALNPRYAPAWHNLGNVFSLMGMWDQALDAYRRVLILNPDSTATRQNEAIVMRMKAQNAPPQAEWHDAVWYETLAVKLTAEGRELLAKEAAETAQKLRKKR